MNRENCLFENGRLHSSFFLNKILSSEILIAGNTVSRKVSLSNYASQRDIIKC